MKKQQVVVVKVKKKNRNSSNSKENKKYNLEENGVLTQNQDVDWNNIKKKKLKIFTFRLSTITLDLYQSKYWSARYS